MNHCLTISHAYEPAEIAGEHWPRTQPITMSQRTLLWFTGAIITLMVLCSIAYLRGRREFVTITVRNDSSEIIRSVHIRAFSLIPAVTELGPLAPKQTVTIRLLASGYSGYSIKPTFASGRSFTTEEREALGGYAITEHILDTESQYEWDSVSTLYERAFRARYGWWLFPVFADDSNLNGQRYSTGATKTWVTAADGSRSCERSLAPSPDSSR